MSVYKRIYALILSRNNFLIYISRNKMINTNNGDYCKDYFLTTFNKEIDYILQNIYVEAIR